MRSPFSSLTVPFSALAVDENSLAGRRDFWWLPAKILLFDPLSVACPLGSADIFPQSGTACQPPVGPRFVPSPFIQRSPGVIHSIVFGALRAGKAPWLAVRRISPVKMPESAVLPGEMSDVWTWRRTPTFG